MAYTQSEPVVTRTMNGGRYIWRVSFTETEASSTSQWTVSDGSLPLSGTIILYTATRTAGTGTTIQPEIGRATGWTINTQDHIARQTSAAAHIHDSTGAIYALVTASPALFGRSTPNSAVADHTIYTELLIIDGVI